MTNEITQADGASSRSVGYWDLVNPSSGTNNIVLTFTTAGSGVGQLAGISFYNVNQTTPLFATNKSSGTSNNPNVSITSAPWNFVVSSVGANGAGFVDTQDGTWNLFAPQSAGQTVNYVGYKSGSSISITRSDSLTLSKAWAAIIASIQPAVSYPKTFNNVKANNMSVN